MVRPTSACLCAWIIVIAILPVRSHAADDCGYGELTDWTLDKVLGLVWTGKINSAMEGSVRAAFKKAKGDVTDVVLWLHSCGGDGIAMRQTISTLRDIKKTHRLVTLVGRGGKCGSACIPIFLQGSERFAALTSVWLFHQSRVADLNPNSIEWKVDDKWTNEAFREFFIPAGVSRKWLKMLKREIDGHDYWQTGADLWNKRSGIITRPIGNTVERIDVPPIYFAPVVVCGAMCRG